MSFDWWGCFGCSYDLELRWIYDCCFLLGLFVDHVDIVEIEVTCLLMVGVDVVHPSVGLCDRFSTGFVPAGAIHPFPAAVGEA